MPEYKTCKRCGFVATSSLAGPLGMRCVCVNPLLDDPIVEVKIAPVVTEAVEIVETPVEVVQPKPKSKAKKATAK